ncbi:hypothetical protein O988_05200 [Pseudogymnoascus sp. VKM F-3808]|nr:hypothetical protein O988_05200 [Pseudogymnoascus sp. VKM F-3808]
MPRPRTHDSENCWSGVTDPKKRKQIQDRLAQRARRQRLAAQHRSSGSKTTSSTTSMEERSTSTAELCQAPPADSLALALTVPRSPSTLSSRVVVSPPPAPCLRGALHQRHHPVPPLRQRLHSPLALSTLPARAPRSAANGAAAIDAARTMD